MSEKHVGVYLGVPYRMRKTRTLVGHMAVVQHPAPYGGRNAPHPELLGHSAPTYAAFMAAYAVDFKNSILERSHNRAVHRGRRRPGFPIRR